MSTTTTRPRGVPAKHIRPGDRIRFNGRRRDVGRARPTGGRTVTLDLHGVYLRLPEDQRLRLICGEGPAPGSDELFAA